MENSFIVNVVKLELQIKVLFDSDILPGIAETMKMLSI